MKVEILSLNVGSRTRALNSVSVFGPKGPDSKQMNTGTSLAEGNEERRLFFLLASCINGY